MSDEKETAELIRRCRSMSLHPTIKYAENGEVFSRAFREAGLTIERQAAQLAAAKEHYENVVDELTKVKGKRAASQNEWTAEQLKLQEQLAAARVQVDDLQGRLDDGDAEAKLLDRNAQIEELSEQLAAAREYYENVVDELTKVKGKRAASQNEWTAEQLKLQEQLAAAQEKIKNLEDIHSKRSGVAAKYTPP